MADSYGGSPFQIPDVCCARSVLARAHRLTMPTLVAHREAEKTIPVCQSRNLQRILRSSQSFIYKEIPNGNHDSPLALNDAFEWALERVQDPQICSGLQHVDATR